MSDRRLRERMRRRLDRQFEALIRLAPFTRSTMAALRGRRMAIVRVPVGILLLLGGVLSFLPVLGLWMLPLGLLLLAVDLPLLRPVVTTATIHARRRITLVRRRWRR